MSARTSNAARRPATATPTRCWPHALFVALAALFVFWPASNYGFVNWDDTSYVRDNPMIAMSRPGASSAPTASERFGGLWRMWTTLDLPQYYPLTFTTFWAEAAIWGDNARGFHVVNILLHAANAALVVLLLTRLGLSRGAATAAALLFAVAPVQVMSVAWISERKNLLSTLFALLTMLAWSAALRRERWGASYAAALLAFAAALLSKSAWLVLPIVLLGQAVWVHRQGVRQAILRVAPFFVLGALSAIPTVLAEQAYLDPDVPALSQRLAAMPAALLLYVARTLAPIGLSPFYPKWDASFASPAFVAAVLALAGIAAALWRFGWKLEPVQRWGVCLFVVCLLPVLGFLPYGNMAVTWVSDHFVYYAAIGLYAAVVVAAARMARSRQAVGVAALVCVAGAYAYETRRILPTWANSLTLWQSVLDRQPASPLALFGRAQAHLIRRDLPAAIADYRAALAIKPQEPEFRAQLAAVLAMNGDLAGAEAELRETLRIAPDFPPALRSIDGLAESWFARGVAAGQEGDFGQAAEHYEQAIRLRPRFAPYWNNLGHTLIMRGEAAAAIEKIRTAVEIDPKDAPAWNNLAVAYDMSGDPSRAVECLSQAIAVAPRYGSAYDRLAGVLLRMGDAASAVQRLRDGIQLADPPDRVKLMHALARVLATTSDAAVRNPGEAVRLAQQVCAASQDAPEALENLAIALASSGAWARAEAAAARAAAGYEEAGRADQAQNLRRMLDAMRAASGSRPATAPAPTVGP